MNRCLAKTIKCALITCALMIHSASASNMERIERYTLQKLSAQPHLLDLLSVVVDTEFPPEVVTVGSAIDYLLHRSGYRHAVSKDIQETLDFSLPEVHRSMGPLEVRSAIRALAGNHWQLHEDDRQRILWFQYAGATPQMPDFIAPTADFGHERESTRPVAPPTNSQVNGSNGWQLQKSLTLRENFFKWTQTAGWSLEWRSQHDYAVTHQASFPGTLKDAVRAVLTHYRRSPVPLVAKFFNGNSVLVIEPDLNTDFNYE